MTYQALTTAITGLRAAQQQLTTISNNVTNATTPGYNRQIVPQRTQVLRESGQTVGVLTQNVIRVVDMNLQRDLWTQVSASSMQNVQINYLQQIQNFNGPPDKEFSIAAKLADLRDSFAALSDTPDDLQALEATLNQANIVADKFNDYADMLSQLRNDTQGDLQTSVERVNGLLQEITNINTQIRNAESFGNSIAGLQDQRDIAIKSLTEEIDISFFERSDGVLVVQTRDGLELAGDVAHSLEFEAVPIGALAYYPESVSALNLLNITNNHTTTIDITERGIGGKIGGLLELRDSTIPRYTAQLDELAYQTASRMEAQGLRLFTDQNGLVPLNTAPDPTTLPTPTPVPYVDFARNIQVNRNVTNDLTLLQQGTHTQDVTVPTGDNSVIRRIVEFAFGDIHYQQATGSTDLNIGGVATDLQTWLGLSSVNRVVTGVDLGSFDQIDDGIAGTNTDIIEVLQDHFPSFPDNDAFQIRFEEPRTGLGPIDITVDLSHASINFPIGGPVNDALDQIISEINLQIANAGLPAGLTANATRNNYGQLVLESNGNVEINGPYAPVPTFDPLPPISYTDPGGSAIMPSDSMNALGIQEGAYSTEDPSFTVQVGNDAPVTITIEPGDTIVELLDKLEWDNATQTGVPGLFVDFDAITGFITLRPGIDDSNFGPLDTAPVFGGDIKITSGAFATNGSDPALALPDGINVVSAIFGSFSAGPPPTNNTPTINVGYASEITNGSGTFINVRNQFLGPGADISTGIFSATNLIDYAQKIINATSQDYVQAQTAFENEDTLRGILQREFSDESGVNIDEEMSNLIVVQTAYAAAARAVTAADEMFQELINSIRR